MTENNTGKKKNKFLDGVFFNRKENNEEEENNQQQEQQVDNSDTYESPTEEKEVLLDKSHVHDSSTIISVGDNEDKVSLDLIASVKNIMNERQFALLEIKDLKEHLYAANSQVKQTKHELRKKDQHILEQEEEIDNLNDRLSNKQMKYDQVIEEYQDYQNNASREFDNLKYQIDKEQTKYTKLEQEYDNNLHETIKKTRDLEDTIRDFEVENQKLREQHQLVTVEKQQLVQTINEFTKRVSVSNTQYFESSKDETSSTTEPQPEKEKNE